MIVRKTGPEEARRVNELFALAFETAAEKGPADPENGRICHWAAFTEEGEMMSTLSVTDFAVNFDGQRCKMGGVGGVATPPQFRRRGGIRACFTRALPELYRAGYDFSYLYPFSTAYYRKFGYESCVQRLACAVDLSLLPSAPEEGSFRLAEPGGALKDSIRAVDRVWEQRFNMAVRHGEGDYAWVEKADPYRTAEYTWLWFDGAGTPGAYASFKTEVQPDGRNLVCRRFCFLDREGFAALLRLMKSMAADHRFVKCELPGEPALQYLLPEWSLGAAQWTVKPAGMLRVVNVKSVLEKARFRGSGSLVLQIRDPLIGENDGCFALRFAEGKAVSVEQSAAPPDAALEISAFSALIAGVCDFSEARRWMPGLQILREEAPLERLFYRKPLMITDYF